jgi:hypothetical protein
LKAKDEQLIEAGMAEEKLRSMNRKEKRRVIVTGLQSRTGTRTGTTPHFALWKADLARKSALQRLKLNKLSDDVGEQEPNLSTALALCYVGGIKTVWDLSQSKPAVKGIGPKRLAEIEAYLKAHDVPVKWTVQPWTGKLSDNA